MCHKDLSLFFFFVTDERLLARELCLTVYSFQSVSCCKTCIIIVGLMNFVSSLTVEVTFFVFGAHAMRHVQNNLFFSPATFCNR